MRRFIIESILHSFILAYALAIMVFVCVPMKNYESDDASGGGHGIFNFFVRIIENFIVNGGNIEDEDIIEGS